MEDPATGVTAPNGIDVMFSGTEELPTEDPVNGKTTADSVEVTLSGV